jgi:hypothetical protein
MNNLPVMNYLPGQQVIILDTQYQPVGSAVVERYHAETHRYTVLYQYPDASTPESIPVPEHRLLTHPLLAAGGGPNL